MALASCPAFHGQHRSQFPDDAPDPAGIQVMDGARQRPRYPQDLTIRSRDDLEVHAVPVVLAGVERPVGGSLRVLEGFALAPVLSQLSVLLTADPTTGSAKPGFIARILSGQAIVRRH
jgi:hypothetical protein